MRDTLFPGLKTFPCFIFFGGRSIFWRVSPSLRRPGRLRTRLVQGFDRSRRRRLHKRHKPVTKRDRQQEYKHDETDPRQGKRMPRHARRLFFFVPPPWFAPAGFTILGLRSSFPSLDAWRARPGIFFTRARCGAWIFDCFLVFQLRDLGDGLPRPFRRSADRSQHEDQCRRGA